MKKAFIRILAVICAVLLLSGAFAAWASASTATPTDLSSVETDREAENTKTEEPGEPDPEEPGDPEEKEPSDPVAEEPAEEPGQEIKDEEPETKPEEKPAEKQEKTPEKKKEEKPQEKPAEKPEEKQEETPEETVESEEIHITKAVKIGDSWSGRMSKAKPAILKLEVSGSQTVHMLVEGKHVWAAVEKSDRLSDNPSRTLTDDETEQVVISWNAKAGSYLIILGPVEPNLMTQGKVTFMNEAAYEAWQAKQEENKGEEEPEEEPAETEPEPAEEPAEEPEEASEPEAEPETAENSEPEDASEPEEGTEPATEPEEDDEPATEPVPEEEIEPAAEPGEEEEPEGEPVPEEDAEPAEESTEPDKNIPESEMTPERDIDVEITWDVTDPVIGDTAHFKAILEGYDELEYSIQWQYSTDKITWNNLPGETAAAMDVVVTEENNLYYWRILVFVEEDQEI